MNLVYQNPLEESDIHLTDFKGSQGQKLLNEPHFYKIIWAQEKTSGITIDGCPSDLQKNQVIFCTPLNYIHIPKNQKGLLSIIFNREFYCIRDNDEEVSCNGFLFYGSSHPITITLDKKELEDFSMIYEIFKEEFEHRNQSQGEMIRAMLKRLIIKGTRLAIKKKMKKTVPNETYDLIRKFHILVEKNFKKLHKVNEYADLLYKSPKTLANVFNKYSDTTPLTTINERILLEARRLLLFSDNTSEEIAYELGFNEPSHFSRFFKKNTASTPLNYKKTALLEKKGNNLP